MRLPRGGRPRWWALWCGLWIAGACAPGLAEGPASARAVPWDMTKLSAAPATFPAKEAREEPEVKALFYEGEPFQGKPTRVFAWLGLPQAEPGRKVPGIVLVHGGAGGAFAQWVRQWNARGYAAIAMDTCGKLPSARSKRASHAFSGPDGWGGWDQVDWPAADQWTYHAVAAVIRAHSLLRSLPEVDADSVGIMGISWGGWLTSIVMGVDRRFRYAMPIYGCGFLQEDSFIAPNIKHLGPKAARWLRLWEPSNYLPQAKLPVLWVTGTNDFAYPLSCLAKSRHAAPGPVALSVRLRMSHGYGPAWALKETFAFADGIVRGGTPLSELTGQGRDGDVAWVSFRSKAKLSKAELCFTGDAGVWQRRKWQSIPAEIDPAAGKAAARVPPGAKVYFLNLTDERGLVVSGDHVEVE